MARERRQRSVSSPRDRVDVRTRPRRPGKPAPGIPARILSAFSGLFAGGTRQITVAGVRYKEREAGSLERALGPRGKGAKSYEVRFPSGRPMTINVTESRRYPDLMDVPALRSLARARRFIHPGDRVLVLGSGTGGAAALVSGWTGPHGAVVAFEHDHESVRFARRRYVLASTSLERGGPELLAGEIDGSFDAAVVDQTWIHACADSGGAWDELWRVLDPEGPAVHLSGGTDHPADTPRIPDGAAVRGERVPSPPDAPAIVVLTRATPDAPGP